MGVLNMLTISMNSILKISLMLFSIKLATISARKCSACTHDPKTAQNLDCIGYGDGNDTLTGEIQEGAFEFECTEDGGTQYCYTRVMLKPNPDGSWPSVLKTWNGIEVVVTLP